jgi:hypothetical protein
VRVLAQRDHTHSTGLGRGAVTPQNREDPCYQYVETVAFSDSTQCQREGEGLASLLGFYWCGWGHTQVFQHLWPGVGWLLSTSFLLFSCLFLVPVLETAALVGPFLNVCPLLVRVACMSSTESEAQEANREPRGPTSMFFFPRAFSL